MKPKTMKLLITSVVLIILTACTDFEKQNAERFLNNYSTGLQQFNSDLTDHFPAALKEHRKLHVIYPAGAFGHGMAAMFYAEITDSSEYADVHGRLISNRILGHHPKDSTFIIVGDSLDYSKNGNGIPVPNFTTFQQDFGLNNKHLNDNYQIYVLESKPGKYLKEEYLTEGKNLPKKWKNGFSRGLALNEKSSEIVYWLCVW